MVAALGSNPQLRCNHGIIRFSSTSAYPDLAEPASALLPVKLRPAQSSNTTVDLGGRLFLKCYRNLYSGINPEVEIGRYLTEVAHFPHCIPVAGTVEYVPDHGEATTLAMLQAYVENQGDGWSYTLNYLERFFEQCQIAPEQPQDVHGGYLALIRVLGHRTGELHRAFSMRTGNPAFDPVPIESNDLQQWVRRVREEAEVTFDQLEGRRELLTENTRVQADALLAKRAAILHRIEHGVLQPMKGIKLRYHGDYHLGQVLLVSNDFVIIDFEGEPARTLAERRQMHSALRDVAGMLRSFNYAMYTAMYRSATERPETLSLIEPYARAWEAETARVFIEAYRETTQGSELYGAWEEHKDLMELFLLEKALYELRYELKSRLDWARIPLRGILDITAVLA
jgi:maltose alpha-D-glucosyltransferase/alpha-amylase